MMKLLRSIKVSRSGASAAEYALILAIVGGGIVIAALALQGSISGALGSAALCVTEADTATVSAPPTNC